MAGCAGSRAGFAWCIVISSLGLEARLGVDEDEGLTV